MRYQSQPSGPFPALISEGMYKSHQSAILLRESFIRNMHSSF